jgi:diaminopimelate epimerase
LRFHKLHGASNDFVVVDGRVAADAAAAGGGDEARWATLAVALCDRRRGVGADGLLVLEDSTAQDFRMRYHNADGSTAEMCGNGIRCLAKFALDTGVTDQRALRWETLAGPIATEVLAHDGASALVRVDMGPPRFAPADIPVEAEGSDVRETPFDVAGEAITLTCVSMGNPHAVTFVDSVDGYELARIGPAVERHARFPERTNFEVVEVLGPAHLRMRVWERGVGETMACGTGACAVAVAARLVRDAGPEVDVDVPGGRLHVGWDEGGPVMLTGPAETAFTGDFAG